MAKTMPQLVKIDRAETDEVARHVEPYAWQRSAKAPPVGSQPDPWDVPTIKLPLDTGAKGKA